MNRRHTSSAGRKGVLADLRSASQPPVGASDLADFIGRALDEAGQADAELLRRGGRPGVLALANTLSQGHATLRKTVSDLSLSVGLSSPTGRFFAQPISGVAEVERMASGPSGTFDLAYAEHMVQLHLFLLQAIQLAVETSPHDDQLATIARATREPLMDYLAASRRATTDPARAPDAGGM